MYTRPGRIEIKWKKHHKKRAKTYGTASFFQSKSVHATSRHFGRLEQKKNNDKKKKKQKNSRLLQVQAEVSRVAVSSSAPHVSGVVDTLRYREEQHELHDTSRMKGTHDASTKTGGRGVGKTASGADEGARWQGIRAWPAISMALGPLQSALRHENKRTAFRTKIPSCNGTVDERHQNTSRSSVYSSHGRGCVTIN